MVNDIDFELVHDAIVDTEVMKKLFISKIHMSVSDDELKFFLESVCGGNITELQIVRKPDAKSYHYGYLTFDTSNLIDELIHKEKELILKGMTLEVNRAPPKDPNQKGSPRTRTKKLFVAGVPKSGLVEDDLKQYLECRHNTKYGTIESVQFIKKKDEAGKLLDENKGFGFVTVSSEHLADTMAIQHASIEVNGIKLEMKKSDSDRSATGGPRGGRGGRGGQRGGRGAAHYGGGYGGYGAYGYGGGYGGWGGVYSYDSYGGYPQYPQYGVSSAVRGRGGKDGRGGARGGRGKRFAPYAKKT